MTVTDFTKPAPFVIEALKEMLPGFALDVGCGQGRNALYIARKGWKVDAVDSNAQVINDLAEQVSRYGLDIHPKVADVTSFTFVKTYDAILCMMLLHFLTKAEWQSLIAQMKAHTSPGGIHVLAVFNDNNPAGTRPYLFRPNELKSCYSDWDILTYHNNESSSILVNGAQRAYYVTRLVAKRPILRY